VTPGVTRTELLLHKYYALEYSVSHSCVIKSLHLCTKMTNSAECEPA
jgi:hypothetical protein